jgi:hypothetical protein
VTLIVSEGEFAAFKHTADGAAAAVGAELQPDLGEVHDADGEMPRPAARPEDKEPENKEPEDEEHAPASRKNRVRLQFDAGRYIRVIAEQIRRRAIDANGLFDEAALLGEDQQDAVRVELAKLDCTEGHGVPQEAVDALKMLLGM